MADDPTPEGESSPATADDDPARDQGGGGEEERVGEESGIDDESDGETGEQGGGVAFDDGDDEAVGESDSGDDVDNESEDDAGSGFEDDAGSGFEDDVDDSSADDAGAEVGDELGVESDEVATGREADGKLHAFAEAAVAGAETEAGADGDDEVTVDGEPDGAASAQADDADADEEAADDQQDLPGPDVGADPDVPVDVQKYERFTKMDGAQYERVNDFLRDRTYITAREWAIARLCADFRTETGVEMTKIGENLPRLVPFMEDTYTPQAVNQARSAFEDKVTTSGATFLYGAMSGFFTAEELDELMYEVTEVAKFLLEVEGVELTVDEEREAEDRISDVMREVRESSAEVRGEEVKCPECGHVHDA